MVRKRIGKFRRKAGRAVSKERGIFGGKAELVRGTSIKSMVKGGIAVTLGNQLVGKSFDYFKIQNPIIREMRFPISMIATGTVMDGQKDLRSAGLKIASAIAINKFVLPRVGLALGGGGNGNGTASVAQVSNEIISQ
tara:strand:- start:79 stop:489 length:411 start_codon:yes stop_codon:yes gene_type:complete